MISPGLADTTMTLEKGRAMVEVADIHPENDIRIGENGRHAVEEGGLYEFDVDHGVVRVFDGKAVVQVAGKD